MTKAEYDEVINGSKQVVVDFWAPWCAPCRDLAPRLDEILKNFPDVKLIKINIDTDDQEIAKSVGIRAIPTLVRYVEGKRFDTMTGNASAVKLQNFFKND